MLPKRGKIKTLDLFAGCGGLMEGFEMTGLYETVAGVEWEKAPRDTLANRLQQRWGYQDAADRILKFDIQRTEDLLGGWQDDPEYGSGSGLNALVREHGNSVDLIVGGPPCQAYSVAGRIRDKNGMVNDYRNFLFEKYVELVDHFKPRAFVFENVPGMLSAKPNGISIVGRVKQAFSEVGYSLVDDLGEHALIDASEYGVPQNRKRLILLGIRNGSFGRHVQEPLKNFYAKILPSHKTEKKMTVGEAIFDLPKFRVNKDKSGSRMSHLPKEAEVPNHAPRYHNNRDIGIFRELALDRRRTSPKYDSIKTIKELYTKKTGKTSNIHKYYVLESEKQSNTIVAHLYKDGLRHIHPDPQQARSITVREAARLQSFPDDFVFLGSMGDQYKMVGNAVPPKLAQAVAESVASFLTDNI